MRINWSCKGSVLLLLGSNKGKGVRHIIWVATNPVRSR